uniref:Uncharacterized protein n=1 Tax=Globisporangium ultimum (strain ATCC 200006 / CBS 805.95 / DAOM BR144) TaxID=431595 RepID=K3WJK8_GLOUD
MATTEPQRGTSDVLFHAPSDAMGTRADADVYVAHEDAHPPIRYTRLPPITLIRPVATAATRIGLFRELSTLSAMTMNSATTASTSTTTSATIVRHPQPRQQQQTPSLTRALANRLGWSSTREEGREDAEAEGDDGPSLVVGLSRAQVEAAERYRWASFFVFLMYVVTFFAWPSYFMSAFGLATGIVGYVSCRLTQERVPHHMVSVVVFVACNYAMMVLLVWVFVSFFVIDLQKKKSTGQPALVLLAVFMAIGLFLHFRAQRVARDFMVAFKPGITRTELPRPRRPIAITIVRPPRQPFIADDASSYLPTTSVAQAAP